MPSRHLPATFPCPSSTNSIILSNKYTHFWDSLQTHGHDVFGRNAHRKPGRSKQCRVINPAGVLNRAA